MGQARLLHRAKLFRIAQERSPASVQLLGVNGADWAITVPVQPTPGIRPRRVGVGISCELEDGSLYRGTVIHNPGPWATLQGRSGPGRVRLIDGRQLAAETADYERGFTLTLRREGERIVILVNGEEAVSRAVFQSPLRRVTLTLENFDPGVAAFSLGDILYQEVLAAPSSAPGSS